jgi:hypothetical protein
MNSRRLIPAWLPPALGAPPPEKNIGCISSGLRYLPVEHQGNQSSSREEADVIGDLVAEIRHNGTTWVNREGIEAPVGLEEILIIAPYNAQVFELQERIPGARVGTVDKFQGREAPNEDLDAPFRREALGAGGLSARRSMQVNGGCRCHHGSPGLWNFTG